MKILTCDIESTPNVTHRWQLYGNDSTSLNQLIQPSELLCYSYKWHGDPQVWFGYGPGYHQGRYEYGWEGLEDIHGALNEADVVVTYNGKKYDIPKLNTAFVEAGFGPPQPFQQVDLYQVVRKNFGFPSNKLDYVAGRLLGVRKASHEGHTLWVRCMEGDPEAWAIMQNYNETDSKITEQLYDKLLPWIPNHPNVLLFEDDRVGIACPRCASTSYQKRGFKVATTRIYQQYQCNDCGGWFRDVRSSDGTSVAG